MANILQNVATYQKAGLAYLQNLSVYINKSNKKFKNFQNLTANLGDTVTFDKPTRYAFEPTLSVTSFQPTEQRVQSLTVDQQGHVGTELSDFERIFNLPSYMSEFGESASIEIASNVETNVALNNVSHTYRTHGDGVTDINSFEGLAQAVANYKDFGSPKGRLCGIIPSVKQPAIVGNGLNQFATSRNDEIANSWVIGAFSGVNWYQSNLLPKHTAGSVGQAATTLTVVSINAAGTQLTMSGAAFSDADAIKSGDILTFQDAVVGQSDIKFLTFTGHSTSSQQVQVRAIADVASDGAGQVVVDIFPALVSTPADRNQNVSVPVVAGMELLALTSHVAGLLFHEPALMLAMPKLPDQPPFATSSMTDPDSGCSTRLYYGTKLFENLVGMVNDVIWGSTLVDEYAMRLAFKV